MSQPASFEDIEIQARSSRRGFRLWLALGLMALPLLDLLARSAGKIIEGSLSPLWSVLIYVGALAGAGILISCFRGGDRLVIKKRSLQIFRSQKMTDQISAGRISKLEITDPVIRLEQREKRIVFLKGNYEIEDWGRLKTSLNDLYKRRVPGVGSQGSDN